MTDCVCLEGGYDGEMPEFCHVSTVKARKPHRCYECRREIRPREEYERTTGKWDGEIFSFRCCLLCVEIRKKFYCNGGGVFGSLWDDMVAEAFPVLTFDCLEGLSVAAREEILKRWRSWKGLENTHAH